MDGVAKPSSWPLPAAEGSSDTHQTSDQLLAGIATDAFGAEVEASPAGEMSPTMAATVAVVAVAIFVSAFLLFWMQPLFAKMVLPLLGGSPSVWNTAMMFFQLVLLAGYGYAHILTRCFARLSSQFFVHGAVVATGLVFLPFAVSQSLAPPAGASPIHWLVGFLAASIGWPFFALSATAPLLQSWFARSGHRLREDPYFLYAASNLGSLLALLTFPVLFEPQLTLASQARIWAGGYAALLVLIAVSTWFVLRSAPRITIPVTNERITSRKAADWRERAVWVTLAFIPSSLLLGVTTYITTDIASAPLLWVIPLALYLLSFVIAFARWTLFKSAWMLKAQAVGVVGVTIMAVQSLIFDQGNSILLVAGVHLLTFFITAVLCHSELARRRPATDGLTSFYFCMSIGGAAGGVFNALIAPIIFSSDYEYYLALVGACAMRVFAESGQRRIATRDFLYPAILGLATAAVAWHASVGGSFGLAGRAAFFVVSALAIYSFTDRSSRLALGVAAMIGGAVIVQSSVNVLHTERSFFGINKIKQLDGGRQIALIHGTTLHGVEFTDPKLRREPLSYYTRRGPVGQALALAGFRGDVAVIGLGTGALACYRTPGESWTFFEIDDAVERIARDARYFHYLSDCPGARIVLGDGRLSLKAMPDRIYDLLIIDAFSSDSVPAHLLTREALALYLSKLKPHGIILVNISNKYLRLAPVLSAAIHDAGVEGRDEIYVPSDAQSAMGAFGCEWMAIAAAKSDLRFLAADSRWRPIAPTPGAKPWTDDFSNIFRAIRW